MDTPPQELAPSAAVSAEVGDTPCVSVKVGDIQCGSVKHGEPVEPVPHIATVQLPDELKIPLLLATNCPKTIAAWATTSKSNCALVLDQVLWRRLYEMHFGVPWHRDPASWGRDWQ
jgi:hypothetical protein